MRLPALGIFADDAALALHNYVLVAPGKFRWQCNFKFNT
jgi:hypothetical protein